MFNLSRRCSKLFEMCKLTTCTYTRTAKYVLSQRPPRRCEALFLKQHRFHSTATTEQDVLTLSEEEIQDLSQGSEESAHKLQVILLEAEVMRQEGKAVPSPSYMNLVHWKELLTKESRSGRRKYLEFLFKLEKQKENRQAKKEQKRLEKLERPPLVDDGHLRYDLGHNHIFLRFFDTTINNMYNGRLIRAMQFSQKIVIDCGYHEHMTKRENINCAKQLMLVFADNRAHDDPFDVHYCNLKNDAILEDYMRRFIPKMHDRDFPLNAHEVSYLDLFPKEKIIYLTPHCREELTEFDHDAVYVIGAIVDKMNNEPLSLAKAKREGLTMAKFPLDKYLLWGSGSGKSLTVNQALSVMLDMRMKGDWEYALRHVPRRKLLQADEMHVEAAPLRNKWQRARFGQFADPVPSPADRRRSASGWRPKVTGDQSQPRSDSSKERLVYLKNILND